MKVLIGVDKGTTSTKTVVVDAESGVVVGSAARRTPQCEAGVGRHEEDMERTWACVVETIAGSIAGLGSGDEILGIGVCGHMGGLWGLDRTGRPVGQAIAWPDSRAVDLLTEWGQSGVASELFDISGNAMIAGMPSVLLAWLARHDRATLDRIGTVLLAKDYVNYRLTGALSTDESDMSFVPCDIRSRTASVELFKLLGIPGLLELFPPVLASVDIMGHVSDEAARLTGLPVGTPVIAGLGDAVANAIGVGAVRPGQAATVIGTSLMNVITTDEAVMEPRDVGFSYLMPEGRWQRLLCNTGGGTLALDWVLAALGSDEGRRVGLGEVSLSELLEGPIAEVPAMSRGVQFLPYLGTAGATAPFVDPWARASFTGLSPQTTSHDVIRSVLEGTAFSVRECYDAMPVAPGEIRITGGGARSATWRQICADVLGRSLVITDVEESGAVGVAIAVGVGVGIYDSIEDGVSRLVRTIGTQEPRASEQALYEDGYQLYRRQRAAFSDGWHKRARFLAADAVAG